MARPAPLHRAVMTTFLRVPCALTAYGDCVFDVWQHRLTVRRAYLRRTAWLQASRRRATPDRT